MIRRIAGLVIERVLPPRCAVCGAAGRQGLALCNHCHEKMPFIEHGCSVCARPLEAEGQLICGQCQQWAPHYDHTVALARYHEPADQLVTGLKFNSRLANARLLAQLFIRKIDQEELPDCIIPMPLHEKRLRQRGFNQSLELARLIAATTAIPLDTKTCRRVRHTEPQSTLSIQDKRSNVRNAFSVERPLQAEHVAIVDDVMTSGHTMNELARTLKQAGVNRVDAWVMTRTSK